MIRKVYAHIKWTSLEARRRSSDIPVNTTYYPHIALEKDPSGVRWSVGFIVTTMNELMESDIELFLLIDNEDTNSFQNRLTPDTRFNLYEGNIIVANGYVKGI